MRFRRNISAQKTFNAVAIISLIATIVLLIIYFINHEKTLLRFIILLYVCLVGNFDSVKVTPSFNISYITKNQYIEFTKDKIIIINHNNVNNFEFNLSEVIVIKIPSQKALKNKFKENAIIIKRPTMVNVISYTKEIETYIKENLKVNIEYYDNYSKALK